MGKVLGSFHWLILAAIIVLSLISGAKDDAQVRQILLQADTAAAQINDSVEQQHEQFGTVRASQSNWQFNTGQLQHKIAALPANRRNYFYTWSSQNKHEITGSASGVDQQAYFVNSFLIGFKPFHTDTIWQPLATLALRKSYVLDHQLYGPNMSEIWQNSRQAYLYTRGDCEDHAILLADWLIALGYRARVVLGTYRESGHAWVVLFVDGKEYLLESTDKRRPRSISDFKLARLAVDYHPIYQFDRQSFWVNSGSKYTTRYQGGKWQLRSKFTRNTQPNS